MECKKSHTNKGGVSYGNFEQSSITKNFVISGQKQVEMFADAIEASANDRPVRIPVAAKEIKGEAELRAFMEMRKKANANKG